VRTVGVRDTIHEAQRHRPVAAVLHRWEVSLENVTVQLF
jgi:hypothetical protein